jgi:hypothetical protein
VLSLQIIQVAIEGMVAIKVKGEREVTVTGSGSGLSVQRFRA